MKTIVSVLITAFMLTAACAQEKKAPPAPPQVERLSDQEMLSLKNAESEKELAQLRYDRLVLITRAAHDMRIGDSFDTQGAIARKKEPKK